MAEFDSVIPAGKSGTLTAKIKTQVTQNGAVSKAVLVTTDAPGVQQLRLSVSFTSVTAVAVLPRAQMNLSGILGELPSTILVVHRADGEKLEVTAIESREPRLVISTTAVTEETTIGRVTAVPGDILLEASLAPDADAAFASGRIRIKTNHPDAENIDIPYSIRLRAVIEARPDQLRLILQDGNSPARTTLFRVQHNLRGQFKITEVTTSNPELFRAQLIDGDVEQQVHNIAVMLQEDVVPGSLDGRMNETLVLTTDEPDHPEISIPVLIEPRELRRPRPPNPAE